ncbi:MAG TPA: FecR family protein, partial [Puia sp.]|nr:FecR family protein [Puia sp.]
LFAEWYNAAQDREVIVPADFVGGENEHRDRILRQIRRHLARDERKRIPRWVPAIAAAIFILAASGLILWNFARNSRPAQLRANVAPASPIRPVADKATLTEGDGSVIDLEAASDGQTAADGKAIVDKKAAELVYKAENTIGAKAVASAVVYNTLTTPRGGLYSIILPDGTRAWLNASSSLRYPTTFYGPDRDVSLTGEAYFEVAPNPSQPFKVVAGGTTIDVLGTHFDVMAYDDEPVVATTLLEGSVKVLSGPQQMRLAPGEQSRLQKTDRRLYSAQVDVDEAIAWKNGVFRFTSEDIHSVMRKLARWYDVEVKYEGEVDQHFTGAVPRDADISALLKTMELTNAVRFRVEGRTVTVTP